MQPPFSLHRLYYKVIAYTAFLTLSIPTTIIFLIWGGNKMAEEVWKKGETRCEDEY